LVDGGLVANAPDLLAVGEALATSGLPMAALRVVSIGTASLGAGGMAGDVPDSGLGWMRKAQIVSLTIAAQERCAADLCQRLLGARYVRIDQKAGGMVAGLKDMDIADASMTDTLLALADHSFNLAVAGGLQL